MDTQKKIQKYIQKKRIITAAEVAEAFELSRQMATRHLNNLCKADQLYKIGSTKSAQYTLAKPKSTSQELKELKLYKKIKNLLEDKVFEEVGLKLNLKKTLGKEAYSIAYYSFSEMLNNAIDHSNSNQAHIQVSIKNNNFQFIIRDQGVGIFNRIKKSFKLHDDYEAIEHLLKGKQTTFPERHSGQGVFFTSRIADVFKIKSNELELTIDNSRKDQWIKKNRKLKGTEVQFSIKAKTRKNLEELFRQYTNDDYEFDKNQVRLKLSAYKDLVSRSQARRLLTGLDKFDYIVLDFKNVQSLGQAYADEVFRVFAKMHPSKKLSYINADEPVEFMIKRVGL
jgi:anti-sigma regulatory factor (Ser/Thr protein kinase)